jgi:hypothetical protein
MRKLLPSVGAFLTIFTVAQGLPARCQDAGAFADVPTTSWAYNAAAELQRHAIVTGWPMNYFSGKRTLTRYEFAIALKRALDNLTYSGALIGDDSGGPNAAEPRITPELLIHVRELVNYFKPDLIALHADWLQVNEHLTQLEHRVTHQTESLAGMPDLLRSNHHDAEPLSSSSIGADLLRSNANDGLSLFARSIASPLFRNPFGESGPSALSAGQRDNILAPFGSGFVDEPSRMSGEHNTNIDVALPLTRRSVLGLSLHDALVIDNPFAPSPYHTLGYGTSLRLQSVGHFSLGAEADRNTTERFSQDGSTTAVQDSNTYLLNLGYQNGATSAVFGYKMVDPSTGNTGNWAGSLLGISPISATQGPFTRIALRLSDRLQSYVGGDYYSNTELRASDFGFGATTSPTQLTGNIYRGTAGLRWSPSRRISLTADYEGVLYDISGTGGTTVRRFQPIEQYITLGAGLNLSRNAILKLAYQIYNQQDSSGDSSFGQNNGNTSVFTTQLAVHF